MKRIENPTAKQEKVRERNRRYYAANREKQREYARKRHAANPGRQREYDLMSTYGITPQRYEEIFQKQNGKCAICRGAPTRQRLDVDHDHLTGEVRGLLCHYCNKALGLFKETIKNLSSAITYLTEVRA